MNRVLSFVRNEMSKVYAHLSGTCQWAIDSSNAHVCTHHLEAATGSVL